MLRVKSSSVKDVIFGIESADHGTLCECGFRSDGYVVAVARKNFTEQRDIKDLSKTACKFRINVRSEIRAVG